MCHRFFETDVKYLVKLSASNSNCSLRNYFENEIPFLYRVSCKIPLKIILNYLSYFLKNQKKIKSNYLLTV